MLPENLTVAEKILVSVYLEKDSSQRQFTAENVVVAAFAHYPKTFGLRGYENKYPCSNKVLSSVMGERGLVKKGWLAKPGEKLYQVTPEGRRIAAVLLEEVPAEASGYFEFAKKDQILLARLFNSIAYEKFQTGEKKDVSFAQACVFWGIDEKTSLGVLNYSVAVVDQACSRLMEELEKREARMESGRVVTAGDVRALRNIHQSLEGRFAARLQLLRFRAPK